MGKINLPFLGDINTELQRRLDGRMVPDKRAYAQWQTAVAGICSKEVMQRHTAAFEFAKNIEYRHVGLSPEIYFSHPLRVGAMVISAGGNDPEAGIVAILHNVLEVSLVSHADIQHQFGQSVADQIALLTVDRERQWDIDYKISYYQKINQGPRSARIVKVMDKLDNVFLITENSDPQIRTRYIKEIITHVVPMAQAELPCVAEYLDALLTHVQRCG